MTLSFRNPALILVLALGLLASACGQSRGADGPAASVTFEDGSRAEIANEDVEAISGEILASDRFRDLAYGAAPEGQAIDQETIERDILTRLIIGAIADHQLEINGAEFDPADREAALAGLDAQLEAGFAAEEDPAATAAEVAEEVPGFLDMLASIQLSQQASGVILAEDFEPTNAVCARHILVATEDEADDLVSQIEDGGDFAELATEFSNDPGSGAAGGDLGCSDPAAYVEVFRDALLNGELNDLQGPVESEFGFHIIEITGYEEVPVDGLELAQIELEGLIRGAVVVVNTDYGRWEPESLSVGPLDPDSE